MTALDTNVLIYACDKNHPEHQNKALDLITECRDGVLLWQVACEFLAASRKLASQGFTPEHASKRLSEFLNLFPLVLPSAGVLERARRLNAHNGWSFWDALIVAACLDCGVDHLYSEDLPGRNAPQPLKISNPFA